MARGPNALPFEAGFPAGLLLLIPSSILRKDFSAPATVFSGPVSLKKTAPPGPSTMAPMSRKPALGVAGPIIGPPPA